MYVFVSSRGIVIMFNTIIPCLADVDMYVKNARLRKCIWGQSFYRVFKKKGKNKLGLSWAKLSSNWDWTNIHLN